MGRNLMSLISGQKALFGSQKFSPNISGNAFNQLNALKGVKKCDFFTPTISKKEIVMDYYRIYKTTHGRMRKDGGSLVKCYGCDGETHAINYNMLWYNGDEAYSGKQLKTIVTGSCKHKECKNLGFFSKR